MCTHGRCQSRLRATCGPCVLASMARSHPIHVFFKEKKRRCRLPSILLSPEAVVVGGLQRGLRIRCETQRSRAVRCGAAGVAKPPDARRLRSRRARHSFAPETPAPTACARGRERRRTTPRRDASRTGGVRALVGVGSVHARGPAADGRRATRLEDVGNASTTRLASPDRTSRVASRGFTRLGLRPPPATQQPTYELQPVCIYVAQTWPKFSSSAVCVLLLGLYIECLAAQSTFTPLSFLLL
jgi:hypothetical protein